MPEYTGTIKEGQLVYVRPDLLERWLRKNKGLWFTADLSVIGKKDQLKSSEQLGYYWGLLVPEICEELNAQGHTYTLSFSNFSREILFDKHTAHELLTGLCGRVGKDGALMRLSDMNFGEAMRYIDNVLEFAVVSLGMNEEALKAVRPK